MRVRFLIPLVVIMSLALSLFWDGGGGFAATTGKQKSKRVENKSARFRFKGDEIIVQFRKDTVDITDKKGIAKARAFAIKNNMIVKSVIQSMNAIVVQSVKKETVEKAMKRLRADSAVTLVQKNFQTSLRNNAKSK